MIWDNVEWNDTIMLTNYKKIVGLILDYKLAMENYEDFNNKNLANFHELDKVWHNRNNKEMSNNELFELANNVLNDYKNIVKEIDDGHFITYDDGGIEYNY